MKKHIFLDTFIATILIVVASAFPTFVNAQVPTFNEIQMRVSELLTQVANLKSQLAALEASRRQSTTIMSTGSVPATSVVTGVSTQGVLVQHRICSTLYRNLRVGVQGDDVLSLQEFLRSEGYLTAEATGYFGRLTNEATKKWQASLGITASGSFGPISRARITEWCGGGGGTPIPTPQTLSASPVSGGAPLKVTFSTWISGFHGSSISYALDFGDGSSAVPTNCLAPADACVAPGKDTHIYKKDGMYNVVLYKITDPCSGNPMCKAAIQRESVGASIITVGQIACTLEYNPVCGSKPIVCITTPCNPLEQTYGNSCAMKADGATLLYTGECRTATEDKSPVVSSFSGPTTLGVNTTGTWSIKASDPENGQLTYTIIWGDEASVNDSMQLSAPVSPTLQTTTFTHSYAKAADYTVKITVRDDGGKEAQSTATVTVGKPVACGERYAPVCGLPTGCANTCPSGMFCTMLCQLPVPVTYSNNCLLEASGATKIHTGVCTSSSGSM